MKKKFFYLFFGCACIMSGIMINNTTLCKVLLQNDVNSYTEPNGGVCNGAPEKCADGGCWADYCKLETTVYAGGKSFRIQDDATAKEGEFACCWYSYEKIEGDPLPCHIYGVAYPLSCCNL